MAKPTYKFMTPEFIISYPTLVEPRVSNLSDSGTPKFSCKMLFSKNMDAKNLEAFNKMKEVIKAAAEEKFGKPLPKALHNPIKDGDESDDATAQGCWTANAGTKFKPGVVNGALRELTDSEVTELVYPGAVCRATIIASAFEVKNPNGSVLKKGVTLMLQNVQLLRDGNRLVAKRSASNDFEATETSAAGADFNADSDAGF